VDNDREVTIPIGYHSTNPFDIEFAGDGHNILKIKYGHSIFGSLDQEGTNKINFGDEKLSGKDELNAESVNLIKTDINTYGVLDASVLVLTESAVAKVEEVLAK